MFGTVGYSWYFIGINEVAMILPDCDDIPTEAETRSQVRPRCAVVTRRLVLWMVLLQCLLPVAATNAVESCWKGPSTMVCISSDGNIFVVFQDCFSFLVFVVADHFTNDPVATPINEGNRA